MIWLVAAFLVFGLVAFVAIDAYDRGLDERAATVGAFAVLLAFLDLSVLLAWLVLAALSS